MDTNLTATQSSALMSAAEKAALTQLEQGSSSAAAGTGTTSASTASAMSSLTGNYTNFLDMLTTQLQDQDPTSPMSSDNFTSELVQFAGVEQQIQTNSNLGQLITLSQEQQLGQSSSLVGKKVEVNGSTVPLQNGAATLQFTTPGAEPIAIAITNSGGQLVRQATLTSSAGANTWSWDGTDGNGGTLPDAPYTVAVETMDGSGTPSSVSFTSLATPTSVQKSGTGYSVSFGPTTIDLQNVQSLPGS